MSREIKFRGKGCHGWFYGYLQEYHEKCNKITCICPVSIRTWKDALMYEVKEETIGQFTGLIDDNGKEIYEHDVVKAFDLIYEVVYRTDLCSFVILEIETQYLFSISIGEIKKDFGLEVIGNIFDYNKVEVIENT